MVQSSVMFPQLLFHFRKTEVKVPDYWFPAGGYNSGMHIHFLRTGGFAGRRIEKEFDTESMPAGDARELNGLLERSGFFDLPVRLEGRAEGNDRFSYRLTVEVGGNVHTVEAAETAVPVAMRPLLDWLMRG